jgi:quinol-cytochrome oxidoreductase complex cytochrome b subunit
VLIPAPLEAPANPEVTPNPAKAPWYFLGLQEMVGYSALVGGVLFPLFLILWLIVIPLLDKEQNNIGIWFTNADGKKWSIIGFVWGLVFTIISVFIGVNFPMRVLFSGIESQLFFELVNPAILLLLSFFLLYAVAKKLTNSTRMAMTAVFSAFIIAFILLTYTGTALRGPNWDFFWPWEAWPTHPRPF